MPTLPNSKKVLSNNSVDVLNAIRNSANIDYRKYVPEATADAESLRKIGATIMNSPDLQNEFIKTIVNRIALVLVTSKSYTNPWSMFKKGVLDFGEIVEEIFVNIAKPFQFNPDTAEQTVFRQEIPDIRSAFHVLNYQVFYKDTIRQSQLRQAFLSFQGITDLISKIIESMYTAMEYDEFLVMKYMLARKILAGELYPVSVDTDNMKGVVASVKSISNKFEFLDSKYNLAKVKTHCKKEDQYIILSADFDAKMDVEVLASAFNMDKVQFMGQRVLVDGFGVLDNERLAILFAEDSTYVEVTAEEIVALNMLPAIMVDKSFFMIYDNYIQMGQIQNPEGDYWNYTLHVWKTFSSSPFANNTIFVGGHTDVTSVTITPATLTLGVGKSTQLTVEVETTGYAPQSVDWSSSSDKAVVDAKGKVTLLTGATGTITVTATSTFDSEVTGTCVITVG